MKTYSYKYDVTPNLSVRGKIRAGYTGQAYKQLEEILEAEDSAKAWSTAQLTEDIDDSKVEWRGSDYLLMTIIILTVFSFVWQLIKP